MERTGIEWHPTGKYLSPDEALRADMAFEEELTFFGLSRHFANLAAFLDIIEKRRQDD